MTNSNNSVTALRKEFVEAAGPYLKHAGFRDLVFYVWFGSPHTPWELYSDDAIKRAEECARILEEYGNVDMYRLGAWVRAV
jgi:hypothetical protein